jgi:hypothetical protein
MVDATDGVGDIALNKGTKCKWRQYRCTICQSCVDKSVSIRTHLNGDTHVSLEKSANCSAALPYCAVCNICVPEKHLIAKGNEFLLPMHAHALQHLHKNNVRTVGSPYCSSGSFYCELCDSCTSCGTYSNLKKAVGLDRISGLNTCAFEGEKRHTAEARHRRLATNRSEDRVQEQYNRRKCGDQCHLLTLHTGDDRLHAS